MILVRGVVGDGNEKVLGMAPGWIAQSLFQPGLAPRTNTLTGRCKAGVILGLLGGGDVPLANVANGSRWHHG